MPSLKWTSVTTGLPFEDKSFTKLLIMASLSLFNESHCFWRASTRTGNSGRYFWYNFSDFSNLTLFFSSYSFSLSSSGSPRDLSSISSSFSSLAIFSNFLRNSDRWFLIWRLYFFLISSRRASTRLCKISSSLFFLAISTSKAWSLERCSP